MPRGYGLQYVEAYDTQIGVRSKRLYSFDGKEDTETYALRPILIVPKEYYMLVRNQEDGSLVIEER